MKKSTVTLSLAGLVAGVVYLLTKSGRGDADRGKRRKKSFKPGAGKPIEEDEAREFAKAYKHKKEKNTISNYCNKPIIQKILEPKECVGLRIYRVLDARNDNHGYGIVLVGVDLNGDDLLPGKQLVVNYLLAQSYEKCPENCDGNTLIK
ncbi:hypothetical protein [Hymenobacter glacieicola]|uniref:Uncharacterized protein n=1 Tax=Hymenobacter glacieicola TaxID=1562124 RepID=A0ABQ1WS33_9BACT|nr:hypothetical protein [Hymenobacter glacieicola]GGG39782.1 hypothetical protein GCM10011378_15070 [Hymenobacter glacieicola]